MEQQNTNSMWVRVYSADGFEMSVTLAVGSVAEASARLNDIREAGWLPRRPDAPTGEVEQIAAVIKRQPKQGTTQVDFYPAWSHNNKFGKHKYASMYLDTPDDVAQFEAQSGLKLANLPTYKSKTPIEREPGEVNEFEVAVAHPFAIRRVPNGTHDNGMSKYAYQYDKPLTIAPATPPVRMIANLDDAKALLTECWNRWELTSENVLKALGVSKFSEWKQSYDAALAQVGAVVEALQS